MSRDLYIAGPAGAGAPRAWKLTRNSELIGYHDSQKAAVDCGVLLCRNRLKVLGKLGELQVHGKGGRIRLKYTFGDDPVETKG